MSSAKMWSRACGAGVLGAAWLIACAALPVAPLDGPEGDAAPESSTRGDAEPASTDAATMDSAASDADVDADADADAAPVVLKRFSGHVDYNGPVAGAAVTMLSPTAMTTTTDQSGDFFFYAPVGSAAVVKVVAPNLFPMIRGIVIADANRIRNFYLAGPPEQQAAQSLGFQFDAAKGIVEVDFRNSVVGGYGVTLTKSGVTDVPGFGIALDATSTPQSSMFTLTGGDGSTLLLGDVAPGTVSFTPQQQDAGVMACKPCDAPTLPIQAGVVTWFDFECGSATDCQ